MKNLFISASNFYLKSVEIEKQTFQFKFLSSSGQRAFAKLFFFFLLVSFRTFGQTNMETHHMRLTELNTLIMEKAMKLTGDANSSQMEMKILSLEIKNHLVEAKNHLAKMVKEKPQHKMMCAAMKMHYKQASRHQKKLKSELSKANPNMKKVRDHATKLHEVIMKSENEHKTLMEKMN